MSPQIVECSLATKRPRREANWPPPCARQVTSGRVPRIARLMALALRFEELVRSGVVRDYAELARLGQVSRARMTQIMNLLHLAPDIQEQILFLPPLGRGRDWLGVDQIHRLTAVLDWPTQRRNW